MQKRLAMCWLKKTVRPIQFRAAKTKKVIFQGYRGAAVELLFRTVGIRVVWMSMGLVTMSGMAAAQQGGGGNSGVCGMPGGNALVPLVMNLVSGALVLGGIVMVGYGLLGITTNSRRGTSGRTVVITGIAALAIGLVFGQIPGWMAGIMGTNLGSMGLQCL